ncbi:demethylmenaquinone methyltransferase/aldolase [Pavlovales sp. CCMP2436]|nr:demethylmenaquinone methyltransferase/aldolase [Pavlovales sp. CCMP2436]
MLGRVLRAAPAGLRAAHHAAPVRYLAMGPAVGGHVSDETLDKLGTLSTQALIDGLWVMGWPSSFIEGARPLAKGQKCVGRAVTLNFVPHRPDVQMDKPAGEASPEYEAFEKCGPREVLVMASVGPWESVGGDIKFLRLKQLKVGGLVTDGSVRDTDEILSYGFPVFSFSTTAKQGPAIMQPWECNGLIECGGVVVRPGDAIIGDQDGVVVVPAAVAEKVYELAHGREVVEKIIKAELVANPGPPGKYYPFKPPIKPESPLGQLLTRKGVKFSHSLAGPRRSFNASAGARRTFAAYPGLVDDKYLKTPESFQATIAFMAEHRATAVLRTPSKESAAKAMEAAINGGFKLCEFTLTTPGCLDVLADFRKMYDGKTMVGCGTVMTVDDAKRAMDAGAQFIIAPILVPEVVSWCRQRNIVICPGTQTPTEAYTAFQAGAPIQKIFPGVAAGHMWIKAVSAALPMLSLMPTSGVDLDNAGEYLKAGAFGVGLVAPLFPPDAVASGNWDAITANAVKVIGNVKAAGPMKK